MVGNDHNELGMASNTELAVPELQQGSNCQGAPGGGHTCNSPDPWRVGLRAEYAGELHETLRCLEADAGVTAV